MRFNFYLNPDLHFVNSGLLENPMQYVQVLMLKSERHLSSDSQTLFYQSPFSYLFSICFTSAPKEQEYKENIFQEPPKMSQPVKVYSRKTTPQYPKYSQWIPKRGIMKPKQAAPSKNCKTILGGKLASFESMCWTPRIKAPAQHIPVSCSIFPSSDLYMSGFLLGKIML